MCAQVWGLRDQVMCGIARRTLLRPDACALVPKRCRDHKQQLSVGDGGEGGTTRFIHYFFIFLFLLFANHSYDALARFQILVLLFLRVW